MSYYYTLISVAEIHSIEWEHETPTRMWSNRSSHILLVGMQKWHNHFWRVFSCKVKHILTVWSNNTIPRYLPKRNENLNSHKKQFAIWIVALVITSKLETTQVFFSRWMDNLWYIHTMEYYLGCVLNGFSHVWLFASWTQLSNWTITVYLSNP